MQFARLCGSPRGCYKRLDIGQQNLSAASLFEGEVVIRDVFDEKYLSSWPDFRTSDADDRIEAEIANRPDDIKTWLLYLRLKRDADTEYRFLIYIRALHSNPFSYKLWMMFLDELDVWLDSVTDLNHSETRRGARRRELMDLLNFVEVCYTKAIAHLPRLVKLRLRFVDFLWRRRRQITRTRKAFDSILKELPLTLHRKVWDKYLAFAQEANVEEMSLCLYRRYTQLFPEYTEVFVDYLISVGQWDEAAERLAKCCGDPHFESIREDRTKQQMWMDLCLLISEHANVITSVDGNTIIRAGIRQFTDSVAILWCALATFYMSKGCRNACIAVFEEALSSVQTVEDFKDVYHAFTEFLQAAVERLLLAKKDSDITTSELNFLMDKLERLVDNRAEMLSYVRIRRNPHDVCEWLNRIQFLCQHRPISARTALDPSERAEQERETDEPLGQDGPPRYKKSNIHDPAKIVAAFSQAVATIDPFKAIGKPAALWIEFARFYELFDDLPNARRVLERAAEAPHKTLESLASIWCERIELELRYKNYDNALSLARQSVSPPNSGVVDISGDENSVAAVQSARLRQRLQKSIRLWALRADLEDSFGTVESLKACYGRMFDLKTITVQQILIYAESLERRKFYEDAFQVYEQGINASKWPHCADLRLTYLSKFVSRCGNRKIDRARELFEEAVADVPRKFALRFFFMYAKFEEHYGLIRHALAIYHRATFKVLDEEKGKVYRILIALTAEHFGIMKTRPIFAEAIDNGLDEHVVELGQKFAEMETALMDIDRARAVFEHCSQFADPTSSDNSFWKQWREFEISHGDEDTFKEMLRKKRAVTAQFEEVKALTFDAETIKQFEKEAEQKLEQDLAQEPKN